MREVSTIWYGIIKGGDSRVLNKCDHYYPGTRLAQVLSVNY